jgi:hypothetical protein
MATIRNIFFISVSFAATLKTFSPGSAAPFPHLDQKCFSWVGLDEEAETRFREASNRQKDANLRPVYSMEDSDGFKNS